MPQNIHPSVTYYFKAAHFVEQMQPSYMIYVKLRKYESYFQMEKPTWSVEGKAEVYG